VRRFVSVWSVEQVAQIADETAEELVQWRRHRDGSLHVDYRGEALILQRDDAGGVILTVLPPNETAFTVLAESRHPDYADVFIRLWSDANATAS
jgi:hypothetical protein